MAIFQKTTDYHFFVTHIAFDDFLFFRKKIKSRFARSCGNLQKKYLLVITGAVFCALIFTFNTMFTFWEISIFIHIYFFFYFCFICQLDGVYVCGANGDPTKWVSIFENCNFLSCFTKFFWKILHFFEMKVKWKWNRGQTRFHWKPVIIRFKWFSVGQELQSIYIWKINANYYHYDNLLRFFFFLKMSWRGDEDLVRLVGYCGLLEPVWK